MKKSKTLSIATFLGAMLTLVLPPTESLATHFRYGHITWTDSGGNDVEVTIQNAWRRNGYFTTNNGCVDPATLTSVACSSPDGIAGVGDVIIEFIGGTKLNWGDGSPTVGLPFGPLLYLVTAIDPANNWLFGLALDPASFPALDTTLAHSYATAGDYTVFINSCCRISGVLPPNEHINNPDGGYRVEALINAGIANDSPVSVLPPITNCPIDMVCNILVPGADGNLDALSFRMSTSAEASSGFTQPGPPDAPNAASIDSLTGVYDWDTTGATLAGNAANNTLFSTQVTIEDGLGKVAVDFLIQLVTEDVQPPVILPAPGNPPICETTKVVTVGQTLTFDVIGSDPDPEDVTLNVVGLPLGAAMTPTLPIIGNPVTSSFSWTPDDAQVGMHVVNFFATSESAGQALCPVTLDVSDAVPVDIDIKWLSNPNGFSCRSMGLLPVTVFGTVELDVTEIDAASPRLVRADGIGGEVGPPVTSGYSDNGSPGDVGIAVDGVEVFNTDGILDLDVGFDSRAVVDLIDCGLLAKGDESPTLVLIGNLVDGTPITSTPADDIGIDRLAIK